MKLTTQRRQKYPKRDLRICYALNKSIIQSEQWTHKDRVVLEEDQFLSILFFGGTITYICRLLYEQNRNALASHQHIYFWY